MNLVSVKSIKSSLSHEDFSTTGSLISLISSSSINSRRKRRSMFLFLSLTIIMIGVTGAAFCQQILESKQMKKL